MKAKEFKAADDFDFDVLVFPGGSGSGQAKSLGEKGKEKVIAHLKKGKGVIGICAGAYLMLQDGGMPLVDGVLLDGEHWARGKGSVELKVDSKIFSKKGTFTIHYENGPLIQPAKTKLSDYAPLATFASDIQKKQTMIGAHAVVAAEYEKGRIVLFSPHPEESGLEWMLEDAARWVLRK